MHGTVRVFVLAGVVSVCVLPAEADWVLSVGFESSEGFVTGPLGGQQGWTGDPQQPADTSLEFVAQFSSQVVRVSADGGFDGSFHLGAASPLFAAPPDRFVIVEQAVMIDGSGGADFVIQTVDSAVSEPAVALQFTSAGDLLVNAADTGFNWTPGATMAVSVEHDQLLHQAAVYINAIPVISSVSIGHVDLIDQLQYGTDDYVSGTPASLYFDNVVVMPEPSCLLLLLAGGVVCTSRRRLG